MSQHPNERASSHFLITLALWRGIIPEGRYVGTHGRVIHWTLARAVRAANSTKHAAEVAR